MPIRLAVVASSEVARKARPELGAVEKLVEPDDHQDAEAKVRSGMTPRLTTANSDRGRGKAPVGRRWLSAENPSSRAFWSTTDSPKVTSSGGRISSPRTSG
jgi:hypothetical protein